MTIVSSDTAVTQIEAGAVDLYASNLSTPAEFQAIIDAGLERSYQFGLFYEITYNPVGPIFGGTGGFNPFASTKIRQAMDWFIDRDYINQEVYGGVSVPKFVSIVSGFPDYARYVDLIRPLEAKYAYDYDKAVGIITAEMEAMGAVKDADGKWMHGGLGCVPEDWEDPLVTIRLEDAEVVEEAESVVCGDPEPVTLVFLIRTDSDGTRVPIGDYIANELEKIGFTVDRQYKTSSEASALWIATQPDDGLWHLYTGAWGASNVSRDDGFDFLAYYTSEGWLAGTGLAESYAVTDEFYSCAQDLGNNVFSSMEERRELFAVCLPLTFEHAYRTWLVDGKGASTWRPGIEVAYDLSAGVDINTLWPLTLRFTDQVGGTLNWSTPDLFIDPNNPVGGSNWTYDSQWRIGVSDWDVVPNPHTGLFIPQRIERAEVTIQTGLPVGKTLDWVDLSFADTIEVPADAWIDWDPATETFIEAGEGVTSKVKVVVYYPDDLFDTIYWHDGSPLSTADFILNMIYTFAPGMEGSSIYDESAASALATFMQTFKGFKLVSEDPLTFEWYSDTYSLDAENNVVTRQYRSAFWPEYGFGVAPWHTMAIATRAEAAEELAFTTDKADLLEVEWMNFIGGPSLDILETNLDEALAETYIPFEATMGDYITADEAETRYKNLKHWYNDKGHFWVNSGPYYLDQVFLVEKTLTLKHNPYYSESLERWSGFSSPKLSEVSLDGPGLVTVGQENTFTVFVDYEGAPYPMTEVLEVKYLLFDPTGELIEVGPAEMVTEGEYEFTLSVDGDGAYKVEVAAIVIPVSIPSFATLEFVAE
jgi:peptide/nickel transport system substrate-binding protein